MSLRRAEAVAISLSKVLIAAAMLASPGSAGAAGGEKKVAAPKAARPEAGDDAKAKGGANDARWCRACHLQARFNAASVSKSAHFELTCRDCHVGYHFNPHEPVEKPDEEVGAALKGLARHDPVALAECTASCHDDLVSSAGRFPHGAGRKGAPRGPKARTPYCLDCHGDSHLIPASEKQAALPRRRLENDKCLHCHADERVTAAAKVSREVLPSYEDSVHGRMLTLGSERAPGCVDCHGGHELVTKPEKMLARCRKCHAKATPKFAGLVTHKPLGPGHRPVSFYTQKFFGWLTFLTIAALGVHILLDLARALLGRLAGGRSEKE